MPRENGVDIKQVLALCTDIWNLVSPVLTHDSPEGNLHSLVADTPSLSPLRNATAQDLLSSSWRSLKEASALLSAALLSPISTLEEYESAGILFMEWLSRIRHRGAFSAVMPAFEGLCIECFKDATKNLRTLPSKWLNVSSYSHFVIDLGMSNFDDRDKSLHYSSLRWSAYVNHRYPCRRIGCPISRTDHNCFDPIIGSCRDACGFNWNGRNRACEMGPSPSSR
jgi:Putative death-receptor fusion protein (DUF2428)